MHALLPPCPEECGPVRQRTGAHEGQKSPAEGCPVQVDQVPVAPDFLEIVCRWRGGGWGPIKCRMFGGAVALVTAGERADEGDVEGELITWCKTVLLGWLRRLCLASCEGAEDGMFTDGASNTGCEMHESRPYQHLPRSVNRESVRQRPTPVEAVELALPRDVFVLFVVRLLVEAPRARVQNVAEAVHPALAEDREQRLGGRQGGGRRQKSVQMCEIGMLVNVVCRRPVVHEAVLHMGRRAVPASRLTVPPAELTRPRIGWARGRYEPREHGALRPILEPVGLPSPNGLVGVEEPAVLGRTLGLAERNQALLRLQPGTCCMRLVFEQCHIGRGDGDAAFIV
ncbi:hypothetical protein F4782DRAFT_454096 [Xylaria castorea]|nr:hypothetical protein F4782DRAFT_454096 [Xylaria castorea]